MSRKAQIVNHQSPIVNPMAQAERHQVVAGLVRLRLHLPLLWLLTLLLVVVAYQQVTSLTVAVGPRDRRFIHDANELELLPAIGREVRWTTAATRLDLPLVAEHRPLLLNLSLLNSYPAGIPDPVVNILVGEQWLTELVVERGVGGVRHYQVLVPPRQQAGWELPITLQSTTVELAADPRPIGVMLVEARLTTLGGQPLLPPLWQVVALLLCATGSYFTLRGGGASRWLAFALGAGVITALAIGLAGWPLQVAPFTMRLAGLCSLGAVYGLGVLLLGKMANGKWRMENGEPKAVLGSGFSVLGSSSLVLLMGLAFWLMPVYQLIMTADGATGVTPYPPTFWLGLGLLVSSIVAVGLLADMGRVKVWRTVLLALLGAAAVLHLAIMVEFALGRSGPDFWILFRGARDWFRGGSLYNLTAVQENHFGHVFKVPPFYGMLFVPFVQQDGLTVLFWHRVSNIGLLLATLLLLFRAFGVRLASATGVGVLLLFNMRPLTDTIAFGQIDILLLLLLVLALVALRHNHAALAGAAVALGTLFKLYPAVLLAFFVVKRQWWALVGFALAMLVCNGLALAVIGWEMHRVYLFEVLPRIGGGTAWVENQTLNGFLSRLFADGIRAEKFDHPLVSILTYGSFLAALAGASWLALRPAERQSPQFALQYGLFIILMVLTVPAAWMHYQTIVIVPFFALLLYTAERDGLGQWQAALLGMAYALIAYGNQWSFYTGAMMGGLTILGVSYKFYGLVLLLVVSVQAVRWNEQWSRENEQWSRENGQGRIHKG